MQVLVLLAPKSGVGRTTLARRLARQAIRSGEGPVVLLDADPRGDLTRICAEQPRRDMIAVPWDKSCAGPDFAQLKAGRRGFIVVDAPLPDQPKAMAETIAVADLVAVVVRPREDDFAPLGSIVEAIETAAKPHVFLVNLAKRHGNMAAATAIALAQYGEVCPIVLPEDEPVKPNLRAKVFRKVKRSDGQLKLEQVWDYLSGRLTVLRGEAAPAESYDPPGGLRAERTEDLPTGITERRRFPRYSFDVGATFTWNQRILPCRIRDISAGGLAMVADVSVPLGTRIKVNIPYLGEFDAISVHRNDTSAGLRFVIDEWRQAGLVRDLAALVASGEVRKGGGASRSRKSRAGRGAERGGPEAEATEKPADAPKGPSIRKSARG